MAMKIHERPDGDSPRRSCRVAGDRVRLDPDLPGEEEQIAAQSLCIARTQSSPTRWEGIGR